MRFTYTGCHLEFAFFDDGTLKFGHAEWPTLIRAGIELRKFTLPYCRYLKPGMKAKITREATFEVTKKESFSNSFTFVGNITIAPDKTGFACPVCGCQKLSMVMKAEVVIDPEGTPVGVIPHAGLADMHNSTRCLRCQFLSLGTYFSPRSARNPLQPSREGE